MARKLVVEEFLIDTSTRLEIKILHVLIKKKWSRLKKRLHTVL